MNNVVAHARKVQTAVGLANVAAHNCREGIYDRDGHSLGKLPDYISHPERAHLNEGDRCGGKAVLKRRTDRIAAAELRRKPQRNASAGIEISVSASPAWFENHSPKDWQAYFKDARAFLAERYGKANILHWATHYDETSPHMHVILAPIVETEKGPKYTSSEFLGGRQGLRDLQDRIAADVGKKYGLERGVEGSSARHTDQHQWAAKRQAELERKDQALTKYEADLETRRVAHNAKVEELSAQIAKINAYLLTIKDAKERARIHDEAKQRLKDRGKDQER